MEAKPMKHVLTATITLVAAVMAGQVHAENGDMLEIDRYQQTFSEDFDTLSVSAWGPGTTWIAHTPWNGDFGDAKFVNPAPNFPFTVKDGALSIEMRKVDDGKWRSGLLASADRKGQGFSQKYGYFEMRAKLPPGEGVWPAFWLIGVERLHPDPSATAEIDIVEYYGRDPGSFSSSVHVWPISKDVTKFSKTRKTRVPTGSLSEEFHLYGASVDEDMIRFYLDRKEIWAVPTPETHKQPMFLLVNLGLGSGWPIENTPNPSTLLVDYVRAFQLK